MNNLYTKMDLKKSIFETQKIVVLLSDFYLNERQNRKICRQLEFT
jgi:hypothetical protein